jgi:hypothetical protein
MSLSLLLALLETHEPGEPDRTRDYFQWIEATADGKAPTGWIGGRPERAEIVMRALYDLLHSTIYPSRPEMIGTLLARTLTDDRARDGHGRDLQYFAKVFRTSLRENMIRYLDELRSKYP